MGPVVNQDHIAAGDVKWNEKFAAIILLAGILAIGIAPQWLNKLLSPTAEIIMNRINGH